MPPVQPPDELLRVIERAQRAAAETQAKHVPRMRGLLAKSIADLEARLARLPGDRQVAQQMRSILIQQKAAVAQFAKGLKAELVGLGEAGAQWGRDSLLAQAAAWDSTFPGTWRSIADIRGATELLDDVLLTHYDASVARYGLKSIDKMQGVLAEGALKGETLNEMTDRLARTMDLDRGWAERIVRTEHSRAGHRRQIRDLKDVLDPSEHGDWRKQLVAVVPSDGRTGVDSISVHLQTQKLDEPFEYPGGDKHDHPPNRPNDRETMILMPAPPEEVQAATPVPSVPKKAKKRRKVVKPKPPAYTVPKAPPAATPAELAKVIPSPVSLEGMTDAGRAKAYAGASERFEALLRKRVHAWMFSKQDELAKLKAAGLSASDEGALAIKLEGVWAKGRPTHKRVLEELLDGPGGGRTTRADWTPLIKRTTKGARTQSGKLASEGADIMSELYSRKAFEVLELDKAYPVKMKPKRRRASFSPSERRIFADATETLANRRETLAHELGHWLDDATVRGANPKAASVRKLLDDLKASIDIPTGPMLNTDPRLRVKMGALSKADQATLRQLLKLTGETFNPRYVLAAVRKSLIFGPRLLAADVKTGSTKLFELAKAWRNNRTKGDPVRRLRQLQPRHNYGTDEITREDRFWDPYVGRLYIEGPREAASEVLTMGVQEFTTDKGMRRLMRRDGEHAGLVLHVLLGMIK